MKLIVKLGYYRDKPQTDGSVDHYAAPMRIQGPLIITSQLLDRYIKIGTTHP